MEQLVNWNGKRFVARRDPGVPTPEALEEEINKAVRPKELIELIEELGKFWKRAGAKCGDCFAGKLMRTKESHGCCSTCPHLGITGCIAKPLGCALYSCGPEHIHGKQGLPQYSPLDRYHGQLETLRSILRAAKIPVSTYYGYGFFQEAETKYTLLQRKVLSFAVETVKGWW